LEIRVDEQRLRPSKSEVQRLLASSRLAYEEFGWQPQVSLQEGLQRTIRWIGEHLGLYRPEKYQV